MVQDNSAIALKSAFMKDNMPVDVPQTTVEWEPDARIPNSLRVPARAGRLARLRHAGDLPQVLETVRAEGSPLLVLGAGSNILFADDFRGTVLQMATRGIEERGRGRLRVAAGESWDGLVRWSLEAGYAGLENLILIPGTVGAAPVQNIGAYGVELSEFISAVEAWDRRESRRVTLEAEECEFAYRDSVFKRDIERYIITSVELSVSRRRPPRLDYQGVREELEVLGVHVPTALDVARAVERLRRRKLPDPQTIPNAGSFFKNPVVSAQAAQALRARYPDLPGYPQSGGGVKLSAAWMIEECGMKGVRYGDAGLYTGHALVLVNHGRATGPELVSFAREVQARVAGRFGVTLQPEPRIVPAAPLRGVDEHHG